MMIAGRIIFGMGGESMGVAQAAIVSLWFKGSELAFAFGLIMTIACFGSVINASTVPYIYDLHGLGPALAIGFVVCLFSLANAFGLVYLDRKNE